jgi:hypothetical protein
VKGPNVDYVLINKVKTMKKFETDETLTAERLNMLLEHQEELDRFCIGLLFAIILSFLLWVILFVLLW